jgi:uncharacterized protein YjbI with pentapeptide repeats
MSEQDNGQVPTLQRPTINDPEAWRAYWNTQGQPWRTEPEIDAERQEYLAERRAIIPDIEQGIYPFRDIKLCRADIEWLLATHDNGRGPVDVSDPGQQVRKGIDLRGANLRLVDLRSLPLACTYGGLDWDEWRQTTTVKQREIAAIHLEGANLRGVHLERARLRRAHLEGASLRMAHLEGAPLFQARLEGADLFKAHMEGANLREAHLEGREAPTDDTELMGQWKNQPAVWPAADVRLAFFDRVTSLDNITLGNEKYGFIALADVEWGGTNLSVVDWASVKMLGDERNARKRQTITGETKKRDEQIKEYQTAIRANRQLSNALKNQGLNDVALHFAYHALILERKLLWKQRDFGKWLFSMLLTLLAGYGYRPGRSVIWYLITIFGFALAYFAIGHVPFFPDAFVFSLTSFHGRGFFPGLGSENSLHNPLVILAAFEAVIGLLIEISFIATFTQRFFWR